MKAIAALTVMAVCAGCATITTSHNHHDVNVEGDETPIETVMIENTGWTLFNVIPIGSGDPDRPDESGHAGAGNEARRCNADRQPLQQNA